MNEIGIDVLRSLVAHNPETGAMFWRERPREMFATQRAFSTWNARYAGQPAFCTLNITGYLYGSIFDKNYRAHRVIWALTHGAWPAVLIDHVNGDRLDNRVANLREATVSENGRNRGIPQNNSSGVKGVYWSRQKQRWIARIGVHGKDYRLGAFKTLEAAAAARAEGERRFHGEFAFVIKAIPNAAQWLEAA